MAIHSLLIKYANANWNEIRIKSKVWWYIQILYLFFFPVFICFCQCHRIILHLLFWLGVPVRDPASFTGLRALINRAPPGHTILKRVRVTNDKEYCLSVEFFWWFRVNSELGLSIIQNENGISFAWWETSTQLTVCKHF